METEYKLYITNPNYFNSTQNNFEKNLSGKIIVTEVLLENGLTEKTAVGYVYGIPVPFINPQTNKEVLDNDGKIIVNGEPSLFSPHKVLATEMLAIITQTFFTKYGLNIDFSLDAPVEVIKTEPVVEKSLKTTDTITTNTQTITPSDTTITPGVTNSTPDITFNFDKDVAKKVLVGTGVVGTGVLTGIGLSKIKGKTASEKTSVAPIEDNKLKGIKILVPSQYIDVYEISKYGGAPALVTTNNSKQMVWLDKDYDRPEFLPNNLTSPQKINDDGTENFNINIHLGYPGGKKVGNWSEDGSQVFSTSDELNDFFNLCEIHREKYGNKLTYTLSTRTDWDEAQKNVQTNKAVPEESIKPTPPAVEEKIAATPSTPDTEAEEVVVTAFKNLNFDTNKADIRPESFESLNNLAELLKKETSWKLKIEGHTDSVGSVESNLDLSNRRAASAKKYLVEKGVVDGMISTEGFGESKPIADNSTAEGRQKNRRVSLTIIKPDKTTISAEEKV